MSTTPLKEGKSTFILYESPYRTLFLARGLKFASNSFLFSSFGSIYRGATFSSHRLDLLLTTMKATLWTCEAEALSCTPLTSSVNISMLLVVPFTPYSNLVRWSSSSLPYPTILKLGSDTIWCSTNINGFVISFMQTKVVDIFQLDERKLVHKKEIWIDFLIGNYINIYQSKPTPNTKMKID